MPEIGNGHVSVEYEDSRADVIIDRPEKRNALNEAAVADLTEAIERVDDDEDVRAVALLGNGSVFFAGFQLDMIHEKDVDKHDEYQWSFRTLLNTIDESVSQGSQ